MTDSDASTAPRPGPAPGTPAPVPSAQPAGHTAADQPDSAATLDRISAARELLDGVETEPLAAAAARFDALHRELQAALTDLDHS
ncbi:hypothetical protein M6D93_08965 [Jatrophihabitans telluris]|uniref:Uncharacterized protein n=1 Tax=Jatrophihabitans telluris TaxID=2038343 RepID=A0ABY4R2R6_9ACTN|nr:hypothetical protein [Jatrophihabitans telluris]UQX90113.1 hypothetical protein M6D93_08965 [Jatrophihabitans telluris]